MFIVIYHRKDNYMYCIVREYLSGLGSCSTSGQRSTHVLLILSPLGSELCCILGHDTLPHHDQSSFQTWIIKNKKNKKKTRAVDVVKRVDHPLELSLGHYQDSVVIFTPL